MVVSFHLLPNSYWVVRSAFHFAAFFFQKVFIGWVQVVERGNRETTLWFIWRPKRKTKKKCRATKWSHQKRLTSLRKSGNDNDDGRQMKRWSCLLTPLVLFSNVIQCGLFVCVCLWVILVLDAMKTREIEKGEKLQCQRKNGWGCCFKVPEGKLQ